MRVDQSKAGSRSNPSALRPNSLSFGGQGDAEGFNGMETSNKNRMDRFGLLSNQQVLYMPVFTGLPVQTSVWGRADALGLSHTE